MYQVDPNDNTKQIPKARPGSAAGKAVAPEMKVVQKRPNYVLINMNGTYAFCYETTASIGASHHDAQTYETGSVVDDGAGPIRLDINPVAWKQTDAAGATGDVTFVYTGDVG